MTTYTEPGNIRDILLAELTMISRDRVTIASGASLALGTVLGKVTASGKYKTLAPAASDGTQTAVAVLAEAVDATAADKPGMVVTRVAALASAGLVWPGGITDPQKATALAALDARGIVVRTEL